MEEPTLKKIEKKEAKVEHKVSSSIPLSFYSITDIIKSIISNKNFPDALAIFFAIISFSIPFPFYPTIILVILALFASVLGYLVPLLGLIALLFITWPMLIYQAPLLAWLFVIFISIALVVGYRHYRTVTLLITAVMLSLSPLGYLLVLPLFVLSTFMLGIKRSSFLVLGLFLLVPIIAGLTRIGFTGLIAFNSSKVYIPNNLLPILAHNKTALSINNITYIPQVFGSLINFNVAENIIPSFGLVANILASNIVFLLIQLIVWLLVVVLISQKVINSRSPYKATMSAPYSFLIILIFYFSAFIQGLKDINTAIILSIISFFITIVTTLLLEFSDINIVLALDVMKRDFLGKFGEAFEDLTTNTKETLKDVVDYDETKKELKEAIINPIERKEIVGAYNIKPAKGILLFGPPGTGKTLIMRAIANDIHAKFFYVKSSLILSPYPGESSAALDRIFTLAKKYKPTVLFFDEIDAIAGKRETITDEARKEVINSLLQEIDGFQVVEGIVIVGATNRPDLIDPAFLRPGRFDKLIYMPLPNKEARAMIFKYYLSKGPVSKDVDYDKLAEMTDRYTPADIKNVVEETMRQVADAALKESKVLEVKMDDVVNIIRNTKPSVSLAQLDMYNQFKSDFERRAHPEKEEEDEDKITINKVIGLDQAKKALYEALELPILHPDLVKKYDINPIKGILLFGPPGCGKTMLIKAVASDIGEVRVFALYGSDLLKQGLENAINIIKESFNRAKENAPAIIFLDEIDTVMPSREKSGDNPLIAQLSGELLQQIDGIKSYTNILLIGATNRPDAIDPALLRAGRFDKLIYVPPPDQDARVKLFQLYLSKAPLDSDVDFNALASMTQGYTGADIANICNKAKVEALEEHLRTDKEVKINMAMLKDIILKTKPSAPSVIMGRYLSFLAMYGER